MSGTAAFDLTSNVLSDFDTALTAAMLNAVPWVANFGISFDPTFEADVSEVCCAGSSLLRTRLSFDDSSDAQASIAIAPFPLATGSFDWNIFDLAKFSAGYSVGPQLRASVLGEVRLRGNWIYGDCPQCLQLDTTLNAALTGWVGGEAHMTVELVPLNSPWGGTECRAGFEFLAEASASVSTSAEVTAAFNLSNCVFPGLAGGNVAFNGVEGMLTVSFEFIHDQSRTFETEGSTFTFVEAADFPL